MRLSRQLAYGWQRLLGRQRLLAEPLPLGMRLEVHVPDDVGRRIYKYRTHEPWYLDWLDGLPAPAPGALALDAGANLGWYSVLFDRLGAGRLEVHAFEPDPDNRALLKRNLALNGAGSVTVNAQALGASCGTATLLRYGSRNLGKHSLQPLPRTRSTVSVPVVTLDRYLSQAGLADAPIWVLKLDVEGHEPDVLAGAGAALGRTEAVMLEYSPTLHEADAARAMLKQLQEAGFRPFLFQGQQWRAATIETLGALKVQRDTAWLRP